MGFFSRAKHFAKGKKHRLKGLRLTSVDFCQQGANPQADIRLRKSLFSEDGEQVFQDEQLRRTLNERLWSLQDALAESFRSILEEEKAGDRREELMLESLRAFEQEAARFISGLCAAGAESQPPAGEADKSEKGACQTMKIKDLNIDVSALPEGEREQLAALLEKAVPTGEPEERQPAPSPAPQEPEKDPALAKAAEAYAGMTKKLEAQLQRLEAQELDQTAKRYEALGDEGLREALGVMKAAGDTAYASYLALLDKQLELLEKTDAVLLGEIGKSAHGQSLEGSAVEKAQAAAAALRKAEPGLSQQEAMVRAFELDPDLAAEYEKEYAERR